MQLPSLVITYKKNFTQPINHTHQTKKVDPVFQEQPKDPIPKHQEEAEKPVPDKIPGLLAIVEAKNDIQDDPLTEALKTVVDPELGINIVDLGLIRNIEEHENGDLTLTMIPTSPLCPYLKHLVKEIKKNVSSQTLYREVQVKIDLQQRWTPDYLSEQGRQHFFGAKS